MGDLRTVAGPRGWPLLGNAIPYLRDPLAFGMRNQRRFGDLFPVRTGGFVTWFLFHPDHVETMLRTRAASFMKDRFLRGLIPVLGHGLLTSEGEFWRRQRRLAAPAFQHGAIERYAEVMVAFADRTARRWQHDERRIVDQDMMRLTLEIVAKTLFDADATGVAERVGAAVAAISNRLRNPLPAIYPWLQKLPSPGNRRYLRAIVELDAIVYGIVRERRQSSRDPGDLLSMLLHAVDDDGSQMTDKQLRDEFITLFLAGHETTSLALTYAWHALGQDPEADARLARELDEVLGGRLPTLADVPQLRYTDAVVREVLRLYPPAWAMGREVAERCEVGGQTFEPGTQLATMQWVVHRDPRWYEQPERFHPERWLDGLAERLPRFAYFPFGGGPRVCIGNHFAILEGVLVLATLAQRFRLQPLDGPTLQFMPSVTLRPAASIPMRVLRRDS